jgi:hypothetical protein
MKLAHAFWLIAVAMAFLAVELLVPLPRALAQLIELALAAAALYASVLRATSTGHRVVLFIAGLGLALPPIPTWLQIAAGTSVLSDETWTYLLILRWCIVGLGLLIFGLDATPKLWHRVIIGAVVFAWGLFNTGGLPTLVDKEEVAFLLAAIAIGAVSYWLSNYLKRTEDASGPKA